ncbi:MAG TPA: hypothetical protein VFE33_28530 [Thermoanaerobaculia bacterium]|nr:hypothetical protein [Thermoanaerobaculia bacterium]
MPDFPESDWKVFRELSSMALDRFCRRVLTDVERISADSKRTAHERYLAIYRLVRERDNELARAFNAPRRSQALLQLAFIHGLGLSAETREAVLSFPGLR